MASVKRYGERRSRLAKSMPLSDGRHNVNDEGCYFFWWATDPTFLLCTPGTVLETVTFHLLGDSIGHWVLMSQHRVKDSISQSEEVKSKVSYQKKRTRYYKRSDGQSLRYLGAYLLRPSGVSIAMPRREQSNLDRGWTCQWFRHQRLACKSDFREPKILISLVRVPSLASVWKIS